MEFGGRPTRHPRVGRRIGDRRLSVVEKRHQSLEKHRLSNLLDPGLRPARQPALVRGKGVQPHLQHPARFPDGATECIAHHQQAADQLPAAGQLGRAVARHVSAAGVTMRTCVPRRQAPTSNPAYRKEFHSESGTLMTAPFPMSEYSSALPTFSGLGRYPVPLLSWSARVEKTCAASATCGNGPSTGTPGWVRKRKGGGRSLSAMPW